MHQYATYDKSCHSLDKRWFDSSMLCQFNRAIWILAIYIDGVCIEFLSKIANTSTQRSLRPKGDVQLYQWNHVWPLFCILLSISLFMSVYVPGRSKSIVSVVPSYFDYCCMCAVFRAHWNSLQANIAINTKFAIQFLLFFDSVSKLSRKYSTQIKTINFSLHSIEKFHVSMLFCCSFNENLKFFYLPICVFFSSVSELVTLWRTSKNHNNSKMKRNMKKKYHPYFMCIFFFFHFGSFRVEHNLFEWVKKAWQWLCWIMKKKYYSIHS